MYLQQSCYDLNVFPGIHRLKSWPPVQFSSVAQSCLTLCDPMNHSTPGLPVHHQLLEFTQVYSNSCPLSQWCHPTISSSLSSPSPPAPIPPSIRVFSNKSTLRMRWPKYWSFSFSISPSNEHPGLISFRMDWLDLLAVQGLSRVFSNTTRVKILGGGASRKWLGHESGALMNEIGAHSNKRGCKTWGSGKPGGGSSPHGSAPWPQTSSL